MQSFNSTATRNMALLMLLAANCLLVSVVLGYETGAPRDSCSDMTPQHGNNTGGSEAQYRLTVSSDEVRAGDEVTVRLESVPLEENIFLGFLIQARSIDDKDQLGQEAIGEFVLNEENQRFAQLLDCQKGLKV